MTLLGEAPARRPRADQLFRRVLRSCRNLGTGDPLDAVEPSRLDEAAGARTALREAAQVARARRAGTICLAAGDRGLVLLLHGPTWSLVAPATQTACPLVVCVDDPHDRCLLIAHPEDRDVINAALYEVARELAVHLFGR